MDLHLTSYKATSSNI